LFDSIMYCIHVRNCSSWNWYCFSCNLSMYFKTENVYFNYVCWTILNSSEMCMDTLGHQYNHVNKCNVFNSSSDVNHGHDGWQVDL